MIALRGINFGGVFAASGALNFFGDGWPFHRIYRFLFKGFNLDGVTLITKTTTLEPRKGNMSSNIFPRCIKVYPFKGVVLNAVGLSGPGALALLQADRWQKRTEPFLISFMAVKETREERVREVTDFAKLFGGYLPSFSTKIGLELNISCPNIGHDTKKLADEISEQLSKASGLNIPLVLKINALTDVGLIRDIKNLCDAVSISNTIPWGEMPDKIDWNGIARNSPLAHLGGGGLSGRPLLKVVAEWIEKARQSGVSLPIIACGGILSPSDVDVMKEAGADGIEIGSATILRPWRVRAIIERAKTIFTSTSCFDTRPWL